MLKPLETGVVIDTAALPKQSNPPKVNQELEGKSFDEIKATLYHEDAEKSLLGAIIIDNAILDTVIERLNGPTDFFFKDHQDIFVTMLEMHESNLDIDVITLSEKLEEAQILNRIGGVKYISELAMNSPGIANFVAYADIVKERKNRRELLDFADELRIQASGVGQSLDKILSAQEFLAKLSESREVRKARHIKDVLLEEIGNIENRMDGKMVGIKTRFSSLNDRINGLVPGDLIIVAGRPSMGKTSLAFQIAAGVATEHKLRTLVFSLEMQATQLAGRMISQEGGVQYTKIITGQDIDDEDFNKIISVVSIANETPLIIDDSGGLTIQDIVSRSRAEKRRGGLGLIAIDYLQIMQHQGKAQNRNDEISGITRKLKALAKELEVPVILLSQLNRDVEKRADKRPLMSDLRESGAIEQDADIIIMVYRDEYYDPDSQYKGIGEAIIRKARNGSVGTVPLGWEGECVRFTNLASGYIGNFEND